MKRVILILLFAVCIGVYCDLGELCKTKGGQDGICKSIENCEQALVDLKRKVLPTICGFIGKQSLVCCGLTSSYKPGTIATEKCNEFNNTPLVQKGIVRGSFKALGKKLIVGGSKTFSSEFPHMVALGYGEENDIKWDCGGSIISKNYILTAAHCLHSREHGKVKFIRAGTTRLKSPERTLQDFKVIQSIPHPNYDPPIHYNDIALLKLDKSIKITKNVRPACIQTSFNFTGRLQATGWGLLEHGGKSSDNLMKAYLVPYSFSTCNITFSRDVRTLPRGIQRDSMICAGGKKDEVIDTCNGDSGGPLQIPKLYQYTIVGITSFGKICGIPNIPAVYTRVSNYIEWIENIIST